MSKIYLSFLGLGSDKKDGKKAYTPAIYELHGKKSGETEFVQVAEHEILLKELGNEPFDKSIIVATQKSYDANYLRLEGRLKTAGAVNIISVIIDEDMSAAGQWNWFEEILASIDHGDRLTVDLTHGYRAIPIIFSTAMNFLQKVKNVKIEGVYYGAFDVDRKCSPIVDMKDFCIVNEWAEAVSRLVEDADARKMAQVAELSPDFQAGELNDERLVKAFEELTDAVRNVDIHRVSNKAATAIHLVEEKEANASITGKILLRLVLDKFTSLAIGAPASGKYDRAYFLTQLAIIRLLLEHRLFMQAYTVMREFIASVGLIEIKKAKTFTSKGRDQRFKGEIFVNMFQFPRKKWEFEGRTAEVVENLTPYYEKLKRVGIEPLLRDFARDLTDYRNGFDHAWTRKPGAPADVEDKGKGFLNKLNEVVSLLEKNGILI